MTYEISELLEVGDAGATIQATKDGIVDEMTGVAGPNRAALEDD